MLFASHFFERKTLKSGRRKRCRDLHVKILRTTMRHSHFRAEACFKSVMVRHGTQGVTHNTIPHPGSDCAWSSSDLLRTDRLRRHRRNMKNPKTSFFFAQPLPWTVLSPGWLRPGPRHMRADGSHGSKEPKWATGYGLQCLWHHACCRSEAGRKSTNKVPPE